MDEIAHLLELLVKLEEIEILRFKNRFKEPSGGWRDAMINYRVKGTTHVCELQIGVKEMLVQRKGLGGHEEYARVRTAKELLEFLPPDRKTLPPPTDASLSA